MKKTLHGKICKGRLSKDPNAILLRQADFIDGSLPIDSFIRPLRLFTADKNIIIRRAGKIHEGKRKAVAKHISNLILE